jgi:hypothetical protein
MVVFLAEIPSVKKNLLLLQLRLSDETSAAVVATECDQRQNDELNQAYDHPARLYWHLRDV